MVGRSLWYLFSFIAVPDKWGLGLPKSPITYPRGVRVVSVELTGRRVNRHEMDPLVMEYLLQNRVLLDDAGYSTCRRLEERDQPHWFVVVFGTIVQALQRQARRKIAVGAVHHADT